jgi:hypothetical protein
MEAPENWNDPGVANPSSTDIAIIWNWSFGCIAAAVRSAGVLTLLVACNCPVFLENFFSPNDVTKVWPPHVKKG